MTRVFIIAEAGVNHNGREDLALALVAEAASAGADAVKFQTFRAEALVSAGTPTADYQAANTGVADQVSLLRGLELSPAAHERIARRCEELGIEFMSTPFDEQAADLLIGLGIKRLKVPSGEITNRPFLEYLAAKRLPLIVSTGMATLDEVAAAVGWIRAVWHTEDVEPGLTLLHCTSNYPAAAADANLLAMRRLAETFDVPSGYSDHTLGIHVAIAAAALGATVIEKHFTLDPSMAGPDHRASATPQELADLVRSVREIESALGDGVKEPRPSELGVRALVRRSITAARDLPAGTTVAAAHLVMRRPGTGISPAEVSRVVGRRLRRALRAGEILSWEDVD